MKSVLLFLAFVLLGTSTFAQEDVLEYGRTIYNQIMSGSHELRSEFVDLNQYTAYIDRLEKLPEEEKEMIKADASRTYTEARQTYIDECKSILALYQINLNEGATFEFMNCEFSQSKNFPDIGLLTCFYTAIIPSEETPLVDAIVFECIKTGTGWRILDGFYDAPEIN